MAPLPYRRCTDEYGGIEYGGLPGHRRVPFPDLSNALLKRDPPERIAAFNGVEDYS
jgi:hypothetical protein